MQRLSILACALATLAGAPLFAQAYGEPDRGAPGDAMIQAWLSSRAKEIDAEFLAGIASADDWNARRARWVGEYRSMLGLSPDLARTPLEPRITGTIEGDGYVVDLLHYQSRPRLYVTANLYRPESVAPGTRLPAVLYVCGHSGRGRDGNKTAFQSWGIWFARHGYVCLIVDTLQLGEIAAIHHGTYREGRWWWHARGYTSAGVECWNGVRGIDYLVSRDDVDPRRIAVTGISGGGAATFWIAAADDRVRAAVPVSGMADLESYVANRVINGHCDCMFLHNAYAWPWTRIAGLIAPRPLLFINSDADAIFPMDANERISARLESLYKLFGAGDRVDAVVSVGGHAYREDIRKATYRFINTHLKDDPRDVTDSEVDLVRGNEHPIAPSRLRVFPTAADIPADELNTAIDRSFVPAPEIAIPDSEGEFRAWRERALERLRATTLAPILRRGEWFARRDGERIQTDGGISVVLREVRPRIDATRRILLVDSSLETDASWLEPIIDDSDAIFAIEPRGIGSTRFTTKDPPNYVERSHVLVGTTVDAERVRDIAVAVDVLVARSDAKEPATPIILAGAGRFGVLAAYAALVSDRVSGLVLRDPPATHMDAAAPQLLDVLRTVDVPDLLGLLAPRPLVVATDLAERFERTRRIYAAAEAEQHLHLRPLARD